MITIGTDLSIPYSRGIVVTGSNMAKMRSFPLPTFVFPAGETSKNWQTLGNLLEFMAQQQLQRSDTLYAVGGGVTGDLGGLAAALYQRGIRLVQVPTTLLAMVDACVGGKTAVNLSHGKNLAGVFKEADEVMIDLSFLSTLPERITREGMAEVIKYSMLSGEDLTVLPPEEMIRKCLALKTALVREDPFDYGQRRLLNFGHTIGHAVETAAGGALYHGEAVAVGMATVTKAFCPELMPVLTELLERFQLPLTYEGSITPALDKKRSGDFIDAVIPHGFGDVRVERLPYEEFVARCRLP